MALKIGYLAKLYRNAGTFGSPTWTEIKIVRDVTVPFTAAEGDASCRVSRFHLMEPTMDDVSFEFNLLHDPANASFTAIRDAKLNRTVLDLAAVNDDIATTGTLGIRMESKIFDFSEDQALDNVVVNKCVAKPCYPVSGVGPVGWTSA